MIHQAPAPAPLSPARGLVLFGLLALACCLDQALLGPFAVVRFHDIFDVEFIHYLNQGKLFLEHGLFSWYPQFCGGLPSFAGHHAPWYPMSLLAPVLPLWLISLLFRLLLCAVAGWGTVRLLRDFLGVAQDIALAVAACFAVTSLLIIPHFVFASAFPLFFMAFRGVLDPALARGARLARAAGILGLGLLSYPVLALPHYPLLHLGMVLAYCRRDPDFKRQFWGMVLFWGGYALLFAPLIAGLFAYIPYTQRIYDTSFPGFWPALKTLLARAGKIFIQDEPLFPLAAAALTALAACRRCRPLALFCLLAGLTHGFFVSPFKALLVRTLLVKMDLGNITQTLPLLYALLAATGLDHLRRSAPRTPARPQLRNLLPVLVPLGLMGLFLSAHHVLMAAFFTLAVLALTWRPGVPGPALPPAMARQAPFLAALSLAMAFMLVSQQNMVGHSHVPYAKGFESHPALAALARESRAEPFRVACVDLHPTVPQSNGLEVVEQKSVLFNKYYKQVMKQAALPQLARPQDEKRFDTEWYHLFLGLPNVHDNMFLAFHPGRERRAGDFNLAVLGLMNVRYLVSSKPLEGLDGLAELQATDPGAAPPALLRDWPPARDFYGLPLWIYRLKHSLGRAWVAGRARVLAGREEVPAALAAQSPAEIGRTVFLAAGDLPPALAAGGNPFVPTEQDIPQDAAPAVRTVVNSPDRLVFAGRAPGPGYLVVSSNYDPKWAARVNGRPVPVVRADHAFQAVRLEAAGEFEAVFEYRDPVLAWLHLGTLAGVGIILGLAFLPGRAGPARPVASGAVRGTAGKPDSEGRPEEPGDISGNAGGEPGLSGRDGGRGLFRPLAAAGLTAALTWGVLFRFFVMRRYSGDPTPTGYALLTLPVMGFLLALWTRGLWTAGVPRPGRSPE